MWDTSFDLLRFGLFVLICRVCFPALDVVSSVFEYCGWDVGLMEFVDEFVYVDCVKCLRHVECHHDGSGWWSLFVEASGDDVVYAMQSCGSGVGFFVSMLMW